ncbi:MAG: hypothetical protein KGL48_00095 [Sphingomonadales bacterium]|nr:hypothetical protein [Sphingomonadales bacterium]MDE2569517.1 hypothetical protein [Sphingomonadales bacterium]
MTHTPGRLTSFAFAAATLAVAVPAHAKRAGDEHLPAWSPAVRHDSVLRQLGPKGGWRDNHGREVSAGHADDHAAFKRYDSPCG